MVKIRLLALASLLVFFSCNQENQGATKTESEIGIPVMAENLNASKATQLAATEPEIRPETVKPTELSKDEDEIQTLIRQVLNWSDSEKTIDLLPILTDSKGSTYTGFDLNKHKENLKSLRRTNFFSEDFIENYDRIILTLNEKLKNREFGEWLVGDMPPFNFASGVNSWCLCQDIPYNNPNPWDFVEVQSIDLKSERGKLDWKWGNLKVDQHPSWKKFAYSFEVTKESGKWRVSYLQGFDFDESTK